MQEIVEFCYVRSNVQTLQKSDAIKFCKFWDKFLKLFNISGTLMLQKSGHKVALILLCESLMLLILEIFSEVVVKSSFQSKLV